MGNKWGTFLGICSLFFDVLKFLLHCDKNNQNVVFVKNEGTAVILAALKANCQAGSTDRERRDGQQRGESGRERGGI